MNWFGLAIMAAGAFSVAAAVLDWDWYMNHYKARLVIAILGRTGARIFYALFGFGLGIVGLLFLLGVIKDRA